MTAYDKARNVDDLERENETLKKLLDLHAFLYEKRVYTCYERMVLRDVKERLPTIWTFINTIFNDDESQRLGVRECLLVMFGPEDAGVEEQSRAIVAHTNEMDSTLLQTAL